MSRYGSMGVEVSVILSPWLAVIAPVVGAYLKLPFSILVGQPARVPSEPGEAVVAKENSRWID